MLIVATKKIVFAISLASTAALIAGLFITSEVRASALESDQDIPIEFADVLEGTLDEGTLDRARAFDGEWSFVGGQKERDGIDAAIATSMDAINPMLRNIGTRRLKESNPVPSRLSISVSGENATVKFDGDGLTAKLDGTPTKATTASGDKVKVSYRLKDDKLLEFIDGAGGDRHNRFTLNADGSRLTVKVKITSSRLPVSVDYRLTFKRQ